MQVNAKRNEVWVYGKNATRRRDKASQLLLQQKVDVSIFQTHSCMRAVHSSTYFCIEWKQKGYPTRDRLCLLDDSIYGALRSTKRPYGMNIRCFAWMSGCASPENCLFSYAKIIALTDFHCSSLSSNYSSGEPLLFVFGEFRFSSNQKSNNQKWFHRKNELSLNSSSSLIAIRAFLWSCWESRHISEFLTRIRLCFSKNQKSSIYAGKIHRKSFCINFKQSHFTYTKT